RATIQAAADLYAGRTLRITGDTKTSQTTKATANGIGLGGDANASTTANASGTTEVDIDSAASGIGNTVLIAATVSNHTVSATADEPVGGLRGWSRWGQPMVILPTT